MKEDPYYFLPSQAIIPVSQIYEREILQR
jgi:hypothetical protein